MTTPSAWRFQWPDGTWIQWNPETEEWEKEPGTPGEAPEAVDAPLQAPIEIARDRDAVDEEPSLDQPLPDDDLHDFEEPDDEPQEDVDEGSRRRARPAETVFAGPGEERPARSLLPTILGGALIGLVVGIVVTILIR